MSRIYYKPRDELPGGSGADAEVLTTDLTNVICRSVPRLPEENFLPLLRDSRSARKCLARRIGPHCCRSLSHCVEPAVKVGEVVQVLLLTLPWHDPRKTGHVGD